jgi:L,D-transpeptidase catalytic domain
VTGTSVRRVCTGLALIAVVCLAVAASPSQHIPLYRVEESTGDGLALRERFSISELALLEKINRADLDHLAGLPELVIPESWAFDELAYSNLPAQHPTMGGFSKLLLVHLPGQVFGAYESGVLVRWGPVNSGARPSPTPTGLFHLNWRSLGHASSINPTWFLRWYFNFDNRDGLAIHQYALPGLPASHGCLRLLERDAEWLFAWGEPWTLDDSGTEMVGAGTRVWIIGQYDFNAPPPWRSLTWLSQPVELPPFPDTHAVGRQ